jgi:hypothetical protein
MLSPTCIPVVMVLESESSRGMGESAAQATADSEPRSMDIHVLVQHGVDEVVEVKLGEVHPLPKKKLSAPPPAHALVGRAGLARARQSRE